ncbi:hypothetical protein CNX65_14820 [Actinosynnema pretiosum]|uniref:Uncharacterized protein n=1 Tax=Actinosynnema pretiosum TaxID=42197 RepID=A0A290Z5Y3_9PSEU|nr:hypothetical protein CNX65_14820 [Actinosynnema pretiosum]
MALSARWTGWAAGRDELLRLAANRGLTHWKPVAVVGLVGLVALGLVTTGGAAAGGVATGLVATGPVVAPATLGGVVLGLAVR